MCCSLVFGLLNPARVGVCLFRACPVAFLEARTLVTPGARAMLLALPGAVLKRISARARHLFGSCASFFLQKCACFDLHLVLIEECQPIPTAGPGASA